MKTRSRKIAAILLILCLACLIWACTASAEEPAAEAPAAETADAGNAQPEGTAEEGQEGAQENPEGTPEGGGFPGGGSFPSGGFPSGGGRPSGGSRGGRGGGSSGITPGKALISSHASGSKTAVRYGTVALTAGEESMQTLTLGGEELAVSCSGYAFTAAVEEDVLVLRSEEGNAWTLTMNALKTLNISGIRQLRLIGPDVETVLDTSLELTGSLYGKERAQGFVSADFQLLRQGNEWMVRVDGREYRLAGSELC